MKQDSSCKQDARVVVMENSFETNFKIGLMYTIGRVNLEFEPLFNSN